MVVLTSRFALLAASASLAVISLSASTASAAAVSQRKARAAWDPLNPILEFDPLLRIGSRDNQAHFSSARDKASTHGNVHANRRRHHGYHAHEKLAARSAPVVIPAAGGGSSYLVSHVRRTPQHSGWAYKEVKRTSMEDPSGTVDLMTEDNHKVASLFVDNTSNPPVLNASDRNQTTAYLSRLPSSTSSSDIQESSDDILCNLVFKVYDSDKMATADRCATYDSTPTRAESMTLLDCDPTITDAHKSQAFMYNRKTNVIRPTTYAAPDASTEAVDGPVDGDDDDEAVTDIGARDNKGPATNVTLVFTPSAPMVNSIEDVSSAPVDTSSASVVTSTATVTSTLVVTSTAEVGAAAISSSISASTSAPASASSSVVDAAEVTSSASASTSASASVSVSSTLVDAAEVTSSASAATSASTSISASASAIVQDVQTSITDSAIPTSTSDTASVTASSAAFNPLNVEVYGISSTTESAPVSESSSASVMSVPAESEISATSTAASVAATTTASVDAQAIAAGIAASASVSASTSASTSTDASAMSAADVSSVYTDSSSIPTASSTVAAVGGVQSAAAASVDTTRVRVVDTAPYQWMFAAEPRL